MEWQLTDQPPDYYKRVRSDIFDSIPPGVRRVLDVGCGEGALASRVRQLAGAVEVVGIELNEEAARIAKGQLDTVIVGDIEKVELNFPEAHFDCIICGDVLEHLRDPWTTLRSLRRYLSDDGILVACIPNLRNTVPLLKILLNRWEYEREGILDQTHLRFFTLHTIRKMFHDTGFDCQVVRKNTYKGRYRIIHLLSLGLLKPFSIYSYVVHARKKGS